MEKSNGNNRKRASGEVNSSQGSKKETAVAESMINENGEELMFEDPFGDDFEEEEYEDDVGENDEMDDDNEDVDMAIDDEDGNAPKQIWRPGIDKLEEGETLEYDPSAYVMYHALRAEWPCLSFDFLRDPLGEGRQRFPLTMYMVCGTQADRADRNTITMLKLSDLHKTQTFDSEDERSDDEDDDQMDDDPIMEHVHINHQGGVNRIRSMPQQPGIVATMADTSMANIFDLTSTYQSMLDKMTKSSTANMKPVLTFNKHRSEGYALDWSPATAGRLATGDCQGVIQVWNVENGGQTSSNWQIGSPSAYLGHSQSVEDIQWSPSEGTVFTTASADKTVRVWDVRGKNGPQITVENAHTQDVNVISWNHKVSYLLASGSDDGSFKVWDLRAIRKNTTLAHFTYHKAPITSVEWAPHDESVLCASSEDNQVTIWDLSVENDDTTSSDPLLAQYPPQLLFIHQGQTNVKELHHHPQIPGVIVTTAEDGFNAFKPAISVSS